jgi:hypothetical protein
MIRLRNIASNFHKVVVGKMTIYFSYETPIAVKHPEAGLVVSENDWSVTTGKHLNSIEPNKSVRVPHKQVLELIDEHLSVSA